jgi:zinc finger protein
MMIPELEIEIGAGALSGRFTTVEGLLMATKDQLKEQSAFFFGDSALSDAGTKEKFTQIYDAIDEIVALKREATLILDDPAGNLNPF